MLEGRLGLAAARVPQADRHGLLWLGRGTLTVENGTLKFLSAGDAVLRAGVYSIPFQALSGILLQPGTTVSHDALRILARHGTGLFAVAEGGVRLYASLPAGPDRSARARRQAERWACLEDRVRVARQMYAWRMGEIPATDDLSTLRGKEGIRTRETYQVLARQYGLTWHGRRYDRADPEAADVPNQAINHAAAAVCSAAELAVAVTGAIPQLGFIHESSGRAFALDVADLFRDSVTLPVAFAAASAHARSAVHPLERAVRRAVGRVILNDRVIELMIDRIKELLDGADDDRDAECAGTDTGLPGLRSA